MGGPIDMNIDVFWETFKILLSKNMQLHNFLQNKAKFMPNRMLIVAQMGLEM